jgi:hypothetical protein
LLNLIPFETVKDYRAAEAKGYIVFTLHTLGLNPTGEGKYGKVLSCGNHGFVIPEPEIEIGWEAMPDGHIVAVDYGRIDWDAFLKKDS